MLLSPLNRISPLSPKRSGVGATTLTLSTALTSAANIRIDTKDSGTFTVDWGQGSPTTTASGVYENKAYSPDYAGNVIIENKDNIGGISSISGGWNFDLSVFSNITLTNRIVFSGVLMTIYGNISWLPNALNNQIFLSGNLMTFNGDIAQTPSGIKSLTLQSTQAELTYTAGRVWDNVILINIRPKVGFITSTEADNIFIDIDNSPLAVAGGTIDLRGNCGAVTAASSAARTSLAGKGYTCLFNT